MNRAPARFWDLPSAALLVGAMLVACLRLVVTGWTPDLDAVAVLTVLGTLLGLALGTARFGRPAALLLAIGYSLLLIPTVPAWVLYPSLAWPERMANLGGRLGYSAVLLAGVQPVEDSILFVLFAAVVFWTIALSAGYALARAGNFGRAVLPAGVALLVVHLFDSQVAGRAIYLAVYSFLCLLLLGRLAFVRRRAFWKERRVQFSTEAGTNLNLGILTAALGLVLLAWLAPVPAQPVAAARALWERAVRPLEQRIDDLSNAIAGLEGPTETEATALYADSLGLEQRAENDETVLFTVRLPQTGGLDRYYWRVRVYGLYENGGWQSETTLTRRFLPARDLLELPDLSGLAAAEFVFRVEQAGLVQLVTPPRPVWASHPALVSYLPAGERIDPLLILAEPALAGGEEYRIHAALSNPTVMQLQAAGTDYPAWVSDHYLQLPDDLPASIRALAQEVTAGAGTPYEKAEAVTRYLRDTVAYAEVVPPAPPGEDPLAWFLFEHKAGFCTYSATAEVVLLRALGIPARMAVGFAEGERPVWNQRLVRQRDAHAWPEVYFPGLGWVEFEPTGNQPPLTRRLAADAPSAPGTTPTPPAGEDEDSGTGMPLAPGGAGPGSGPPPNALLRLTLLLGLAVVLIVAGFLAYTFGLWDRLAVSVQRALRKPLPILLREAFDYMALTPPEWVSRWAYFSELTPIEQSYSVVYRSLRWLGEQGPPSRTPAEAAARLSACLPGAEAQIRSLLDETQRALYGREPGNLQTAHRSVETIRRQALAAAARRRWQAFRNLPLRKFSLKIKREDR